MNIYLIILILLLIIIILSFIYVIYLMFKKHFKVYHPVSKFFIGLVKITGLKNIKRIKYGKKRKIIKALTLAKNKKLEV